MQPRRAPCFALLPVAALLVACGSSSDSEDGASASNHGATSDASGSGGGLGLTSGDGGGAASGSGSGAGSGAGGDYCGSAFSGTLRDFQASHPDFEDFLGVDPGIVLPDLGADKKPVYAGQAGNPTTTGQADFDQWFNDVSGVNQILPLTITLVGNGNGVYTYDNPSFFPIDGQGFGNEGNAHNYHFTFELHTLFAYNGGEVFSFTGDDDLWTFINGKLAIDLGGVHGAMSQQIDLDAQAAALGITPGQIYALDFFFAERHTVESNFRIDTTIASFTDCGQEPK